VVNWPDCNVPTISFDSVIVTKIRLPSNLRSTHPRMRAFCYTWSLPVTWQTWRSHHSFRSAVSKNPMLRANFTALCFIKKTELLPMEVYCGNRHFPPSCSVTLIVTQWPSYTNLTPTSSRYTGCAKMNFLVKAWESYRLTDIQADRQKLYTITGSSATAEIAAFRRS